MINQQELFKIIEASTARVAAWPHEKRQFIDEQVHGYHSCPECEDEE